MKLPLEDLNSDFYPSHFISIYTYSVTIALKVRGGFFFSLICQQSSCYIITFLLGMNSISTTTRSSTIAKDYSSIRRSEMCL